MAEMTDGTVAWTGGARIGWFNVPWPFAKLIATRDRLVFKVALLKEYSFSQEQVISIESYRSIWEGIRIRHNVKSYPEVIVFWLIFWNPTPYVKRILQTGFTPSADARGRPRRR